jgi:hypothetical protein
MIINLASESNSVIIFDVDEKRIDEILMLFENEKKTGGGPILKTKYDDYEKSLLIFYEEFETAKRVINFGTVKFRGFNYTAQAIKKEKTSDGNIF